MKTTDKVVELHQDYLKHLLATVRAYKKEGKLNPEYLDGAEWYLLLADAHISSMKAIHGFEFKSEADLPGDFNSEGKGLIEGINHNAKEKANGL